MQVAVRGHRGSAFSDPYPACDHHSHVPLEAGRGLATSSFPGLAFPPTVLFIVPGSVASQLKSFHYFRGTLFAPASFFTFASICFFGATGLQCRKGSGAFILGGVLRVLNDAAGNSVIPQGGWGSFLAELPILPAALSGH